MFNSIKKFENLSNWGYRGEGNCHMVISLPAERKILRIRKIEKTSSLLSWFLNWLAHILYWYCGNGFKDELRDLTFYKRLIRPLLGYTFVCDAEQVFLSKKQIQILEDGLSSKRPSYRKFKALQNGRAALFDDYAFLSDDYYPFLLSSNTYSIEIKPKQGWIPFSERHFPKCFYCMNQYLKIDKGQIKSVSSYCPSDLFSGESSKMISALKALVDNPQNNFKTFKNGELYYGDSYSISIFKTFLEEIFENENEPYEKLLSDFCALVKNCLLTNFDVLERTNTCNEKLFCEWNNIIKEASNYTTLPKGCILEKILSVQMLDVEGNQYYYKLLRDRTFGEYNYVDDLLKVVTEKPDTCLKCIIMMLGNTEEHKTNKSSLLFVPYLISAIAKDCSLMLTFKKVVSHNSDNFGMKNIVSTKYGNFIVNLGIFDLYPKPISTIVKHKKKLKKMLDTYLPM